MPVKQKEGWTKRADGTYTPSSANDSEWLRMGYPPNISPMSQSISPASVLHSLPDDADDFVRWYNECARALRESGLESEVGKMRSEVHDVFIKYNGVSMQKQIRDKVIAIAGKQHGSEDVQASNASDNDCSEEDSVVANKNGTALAMTAEPKKDNYKVADAAADCAEYVQMATDSIDETIKTVVFAIGRSKEILQENAFLKARLQTTDDCVHRYFVMYSELVEENQALQARLRRGRANYFRTQSELEALKERTNTTRARFGRALPPPPPPQRVFGRRVGFLGLVQADSVRIHVQGRPLRDGGRRFGDGKHRRSANNAAWATAHYLGR